LAGRALCARAVGTPAMWARGGVLLLRLAARPVSEREQLGAQRLEELGGAVLPAVAELLGISAGPRRAVHGGAEPRGDGLDLARGRAQSFGMRTHLRRVHAPEGAHRAPPEAALAAAKRIPCSSTGSTLPSTSPSVTGWTSSAGLAG